ncbi:glucose 1-dehydrogenase [Sphingomonas swuensis]|uniref:Glucose 1-dehydrogenase n=1 Tax=Sphingomonas swuensis TaxID=977800 RepID=A0ABP7SKB3_9SPHN
MTGAARGIGRAIAERFIAEGADVLLTDLDQTAGEASAAALGADFHPLDVRDEAQWDALARAHPTCDVMVNNAGITGFEGSAGPHDPENASLAEWHAVHRTNLDGTFLGCRYAIRAMKAKGDGSIVNISSRSGLVGIPGAAAYASSKAAIRNHSKSVALYCASKGWRIRCNSVHPAAVMTDMWDELVGHGPDREQRLASMVADTPLKRFGTVEEVAAMVAYLAADESAYVTGSEFTIDGGLLAGSAASPGD